MQQFETIIGFTRAEADSIVSSNTWLAENVNKDEVQRYIKYETDETGKHITSITRSNTPKEGHIQADKTLDVKNIVLDTDRKIAAYLFTVLANKGPNSEVKEFFAAGGKVGCDTEKKFLGHVAWLVGNSGYGSDTDLLCQYERFYLGKDTLPMLNLSTGRKIFDTDLYHAFVEIEFAMETPEFCPKERAILAAGMAQDLALVNRFL
jgi:hypothetical protein